MWVIFFHERSDILWIWQDLDVSVVFGILWSRPRVIGIRVS